MIKTFILLIVLAVYLLTGCDRHDQKNGKAAAMKQSTNLQDLEKKLHRFLDDKNELIAVALQLTADEHYLGIQDMVSVHAASTMKVPVMMEVFRQAGQGVLDLNDSLLIQNSFRSIIDGSPYSLDIGEDSGERLYALIGQKESIRSLVREMITRSGNLAANLLIDLVKVKNIRQLMAALGAEDMQVLRGVEDMKAFHAGKNNTTTARALARIFHAIYQSELWQEDDCREMLDMLLDQKFNEKIPAGLPADVSVAHKTGWITGIDHDAGIIFPPNLPPYILVVLTKGFEDHARANKCIADISAMVYQWYLL